MTDSQEEKPFEDTYSTPDVPRPASDPTPMAPSIEDVLRDATPEFRPCPECGDMTAGRGRCWVCDQKRERKRKARETTELAVPAMFAWSRFDAPELAQRCKCSPEAFGRALGAVACQRVVICGPSGYGKTSIAVAMLRAWAEQVGYKFAQPPVFYFAIDLASARSRERFGREAPDVEAAMAAPLLVLDDLGTDAALATSAVTDVIFKRHAEARATWITTWMTKAEMRSRYGEGITRRVLEDARIIDLGANRAA